MKKCVTKRKILIRGRNDKIQKLSQKLSVKIKKDATFKYHKVKTV